MIHHRPNRDRMSLEKATIFTMWQIVAIVEILERKRLRLKGKG